MIRRIDQGSYKIFNYGYLSSYKIHKAFNKLNKLYIRFSIKYNEQSMSMEDIQYCEYMDLNTPVRFKKEQ